MKWYLAHVIMYLRLVVGPQDGVPVWENLVLIQAGSEAEAASLAKQQALKNPDEFKGPDCGTYFDAQPAEWVFAGVRKVNECWVEPGASPVSGDELSWIEYHVDSVDALDALVRGDSTDVELAG